MPVVSYGKIWTRQRRQGRGLQEAEPIFHRASGPAGAGSCGRGVWLGETHPGEGISSEADGKAPGSGPAAVRGVLRVGSSFSS